MSHSCIFFDAMAARMPKARSVGLAVSILALRAPDADVNASRVVAGERSASMSSIRRGRVGDREFVLVCPFGGNRDDEGGIIVGLAMADLGGSVCSETTRCHLGILQGSLYDIAEHCHEFRNL